MTTKAYLIDTFDKLETAVPLEQGETTVIPSNLDGILYPLMTVKDGKAHAHKIELNINDFKETLPYEYLPRGIINPLKQIKKENGRITYLHNPELPETAEKGWVKDISWFKLSNLMGVFIEPEEFVQFIVNYSKPIIKAHLAEPVRELLGQAAELKSLPVAKAIEQIYKLTENYGKKQFGTDYCEDTGPLVEKLGYDVLGGLPIARSVMVIRDALEDYVKTEAYSSESNHFLVELMLKNNGSFSSVFIDPAMAWTSTGIPEKMKDTCMILHNERLPAGTKEVTITVD